MLLAYARFFDTLQVRYITAEDVGTTGSYMDVIRRETRSVVGVSPAMGGSGDPSPVTAWGVYQGMIACAEEAWKDPSLAGKRVAVQGVGKVGYHLCRHLVDAGASVVVSDVDVDAVARAVRESGVDTAEPDKIHAQQCDVFAPCALGGMIRDDTIPSLQCRVVAGAANNQLAAPEHAEQLRELGILYAPDFIINAGGLINVADELRGYDRDRAMRQVETVYRNLRAVFQVAKEENISTARAADRFALERIERVGYLRFHRATWHGGTYDAREHGFGHISVPVGSQTLHAVGYAMGRKMDGADECTVVYFGDGATSEGDVHEAWNFAAVFKAPVVFFVQNNHWAISVPLEKQTFAPIHRNAEAYGFPATLFDGKYVLSVHLATRERTTR